MSRYLIDARAEGVATCTCCQLLPLMFIFQMHEIIVDVNVECKIISTSMCKAMEI